MHSVANSHYSARLAKGRKPPCKRPSITRQKAVNRNVIDGLLESSVLPTHNKAAFTVSLTLHPMKNVIASFTTSSTASFTWQPHLYGNTLRRKVKDERRNALVAGMFI